MPRPIGRNHPPAAACQAGLSREISIASSLAALCAAMDHHHGRVVTAQAPPFRQVDRRCRHESNSCQPAEIDRVEAPV
jgi:hypothetical protein